MKTWKGWIFSLLLVSGVLGTSAQNQLEFRHLSVKDGLSQGSVFCITQDQTGFIWMGTKDGLNKFDGYSFKAYRNNPEDTRSLSHSDVRSLCFDQKDTVLWIGTIDGLNKYDAITDRFTQYKHVEDDPGSLSHSEIRCIYQDRSGRLWVGTLDGLNLYDRENDRFIRIAHDPQNPQSLSHETIVCITEDTEGGLWFGTQYGLNQLTRQAGNRFTFIRYFSEPNRPGSLNDNHIQALTTDKAGNLWIGTHDGGLNKWNPIEKKFTQYLYNSNDPTSLTHNNVRALETDLAGNLWVGTLWGLNKFNPQTQTFERHLNHGFENQSLGNNSIKSIFRDKKGSLWIGTFFGGVSFLDELNNRFVNYQHSPYTNSLIYNVVSSFVEDKKGNFWIGTEGGGLNYFDKEKNLFSVFQYIPQKSQGLKGSNIKKILEAGDGSLWIGTYGNGLVRFFPDKGVFEHIRKTDHAGKSINNDNVYALLRDGEKLWIGTYGGGLNCLNLNTMGFSYYTHDPGDSTSVYSDELRTLLKDKDDNLWVGTEDGLDMMVVPGEGQPARFQHVLKNIGVFCLHEDKNRQILWVGTYGGGLVSLNRRTGEEIHFTMKDGLPGNIIMGILEDDTGTLWLSTNNGISRFHPLEKKFNNYSLADGLQNLEFNFNAYLKTRSGEMLFGGANGFTLFHPGQITPNPYIPPVVFTDLHVFNQYVPINGGDHLLEKSLDHTRKLIFRHDKAIFSIGFSALNYVSPENNRYAFRLNGLESHWNYSVGKSSANYTIQEAGTYTFMLKGANNDGIWNPEIRTLEITVLPPPWKSWWAFMIYGLTMFGALIALIRFTRMRAQFRHQLQLEQVEKHKQEELHQMKLRFFTNITHEFRTPLTLILGPLEEIMSHAGHDPWIGNQLSSIRRNAQRLLNLVNQLLMFRKMESDHQHLSATETELNPFLKEVFLAFKEHADLHKISYTYHQSPQPVKAWVDTDKLEKVVYNLLSNAFKFTPDNGVISLSVALQQEQIIIEVKDNGKGIEEKHIGEIFKRFYEVESPVRPQLKSTGIGLAISRQLIELHKGEITVESKPGKGAKFTISLPLGNEHLEKEYISKPTDPHPHATLLIVEDDDDLRQYLNNIFRPDYKILLAPNGYVGLEIAKAETPDLILSDIMMDTMDGVEMTARLKEDLPTSHIPVILLTARTSIVYKIEGLKTGADDYMTKPFHPEELRLRVKNLLVSRQELRERFGKVIKLEPQEVTVTTADEKFLRKALEVVENHMDNSDFDIEHFAEEMAVSRALLFTKIKTLTDQTPNNFIKNIRLKRAAQLLRDHNMNISELAWQVGFKDPKYFSKCFVQEYNLTPSEFQTRNRSSV
ncbi:MAG: two-component regulator propeller domain-containing protein [Bacteroidia bacterium]